MSIIAVMGGLAMLLLMGMMKTYLEPLKDLPELAAEVAAVHGADLVDGADPVVETLVLGEGDAPKFGYVVRIRPTTIISKSRVRLIRLIAGVARTIFESQHRVERLAFVDVVVTPDSGEFRRRLSYDDAVSGRMGELVRSPQNP